jgi:hypothetical protein
MKILSPALVIAASIVLASAQNTTRIEAGLIQGIVTRAGTNEPISDIQISLEGAVSPEAMQNLVAGAASAGIPITPPAGASLSETTQLMIAAAASRGLPIQAPGIQNIVTRAVGVQNWPTTTTDREGKFLFSDVKPGRYTVRAVREGFFGRPVNGTYPPTAWVDIGVAEKEVKQVSLSMAQGAIIAGRIFDANGAPRSNTTVQAFSTAYQTGFALMQPAIAGPPKTTDDRGEYRLFWLPPGEYFIGAAPAAAAGGPGTPFQPGARTFYPGVTRMNEAIPITIKGGEDLRGMDIALRTVQAFKIAGTVTNSIAPPLDPTGAVLPTTIFFHLANRDLETPYEATTANNYGNIQLAVNTGSFELTGVPPGSYEVLARVADPKAGVGLGAFSWGRAIVDIEDRDVRNVSIAINPAANLSGTVRTAGGTTLAPNLRVALTPVGGSARVALYTLVSTRAAPVEANGTFTVSSVPPGRFRIAAVSGLPQNFYIADVRQNAISVFDTGFDIDSQVPEPIEILVSNGAGMVEGIVEDGPSKIAAGAIVALVPESKRIENRALFASAVTDSSGRFTLRGIAPGDYRLFAWESTPANAFQSPAFIRKYESKAHTIRVAQGATVSTSLAVIK